MSHAKNTLVVTIRAAKNLREADGKHDAVDPYCVFGYSDSKNQFIGTQFKTGTRQDSKSASFLNEKFKIPPTSGQISGLRIEVWDSDKFKSDDFCGYSQIPLADLTKGVSVASYKLLEKDPKNPQGITGTVVVDASFLTGKS